MIYVENKKRKIENIQKEYPNAVILDLTSTSKQRYSQILSPFFPHNNIPIPFTDNLTATCVEAIWQGLKVFEKFDVDFNTFKNNTMRNIKRTVRKYGKPIGHRKGAYGNEILNYYDARMLIYLPTYKWVLDNVLEVHSVVEKIKVQSQKQDIIFLDYNTNADFMDLSKPLSHASLVKLYIENKYPKLDDLHEIKQKNYSDFKKKDAVREQNRKVVEQSLFDCLEEK